MLLSDYETMLDEDGKEYLLTIRQATLRMSHLIDDLLKLSKVSRAELSRFEVDLSVMATDILAGLARETPQRRVNCLVTPGLVVHADHRLLHIALQNLLSNAWKYSAKKDAATIEVGMMSTFRGEACFVRDNGAGFDIAYLHSIFYNLLSNAIKYRNPGRLLLVCVRSHQENGYVCITFSDNGLGIDLDRHQESLFGLYKRFHLHVEGKGLGLHLVKTQVEALNGSVAVESQEGKGSTFTVKLPIKKP
jgi:signal transduction histidine kinase